MCKLTYNSKKDQEEGYKIVVKKKDGRYYSAAMGFVYRIDHRVPIIKRQRKLSQGFNNYILNEQEASGFSKEMVGRTTVYLNLLDARSKARGLHVMKKGDIITVVKAVVSKDVMLGTYGNSDVAAGRRIKFRKEISIQ